MRAFTVLPLQAHSISLDEVPPPPVADGAVVVRTRLLGVCGTDREIIAGDYGEAPQGAQRLILGHESLGTVEEAPPDSGLRPGDLVVGIVRRPDPAPCAACAGGDWDMCLNGRYPERGIKSRNGYGAEQFRIEPDFAVKVDPALGDLGVLMEPTSIVAKAWDQIERIGRRAAFWRPKTALITGAGPVGLLAAMIGKQRGLDLHVLDRAKEGPKPALVRDLGATYHVGDLGSLKTDVVIECTGAVAVIADAMSRATPAGIVCLAGVSSVGQKIQFDIGEFNRMAVLDNDVVFGSVNANRAHYKAAAQALVKADRPWLERLISRRVPLSRWREAFDNKPDDIKVVVDFTAQG
ncbi:MAG: glucose 1-dehydrogenase [Pseudolabrys sp.]